MIGKNRQVKEKIKQVKARGTNEIVCHIHDEESRHVGTGVGQNMEEALVRAVGSASKSRRGEALDIGDFGCGTTEDEAHQNAIRPRRKNSF